VSHRHSFRKVKQYIFALIVLQDYPAPVAGVEI
jgi:hypothetical protein